MQSQLLAPEVRTATAAGPKCDTPDGGRVAGSRAVPRRMKGGKGATRRGSQSAASLRFLRARRGGGPPPAPREPGDDAQRQRATGAARIALSPCRPDAMRRQSATPRRCAAPRRTWPGAPLPRWAGIWRQEVGRTRMCTRETFRISFVPRMSDPVTNKKRRRPRLSPVPPMPSVRRSELMLGEVPNTNAYGLWRLLTDLSLWESATSESHSELFRDVRLSPLGSETVSPEIGDIVQDISDLIMSRDHQPAKSEVAVRSAALWEWAEVRGFPECALQFAEVAARCDPNSAGRASTAGRLCRRLSERSRGTMWFRRAARLARLSKADRSEAEFAIAHLGWGNLEADMGRFIEAEYHATKGLRAARRAGRPSLVASAHHDLMTIGIHTERFELACTHAEQAISLYKSDHPRLPALAHDVAFLWSKLGYFSSAAPLFEITLPFLALANERAVVLANLARAAGACRDRLRYERAFRSIEEAVREGQLLQASVFYHLAEGCRSFEEWARAEKYCRLALTIARERGNALIEAQSNQLAIELEARGPGDVDIIPPAGGSIDSLRETLLRKLRRQLPPPPGSGGVPPEKYPIQR